MHQVSLAQPDAAIDEQGVVRPARILGDLVSGGAGELVALALDEVREGEVGRVVRAATVGRGRAGAGEPAVLREQR